MLLWTLAAHGRRFLPPRSVGLDRLPACHVFQLTEESVMGIVAWIVLGLGAGLLGRPPL